MARILIGKVRNWILIVSVLLGGFCFSSCANGQQLMQFSVSSGDASCGIPIQFQGWQTDPTNWVVEFPEDGFGYESPYYVSHYTWYLGDADGIIASGGWNSVTGTTGDGGGQSGFDFTAARTPIGPLSKMTVGFQGTVTVHGNDGGPCTLNINATVPATSGGSGYFSYQ